MLDENAQKNAYNKASEKSCNKVSENACNKLSKKARYITKSGVDVIVHSFSIQYPSNWNKYYIDI